MRAQRLVHFFQRRLQSVVVFDLCCVQLVLRSTSDEVPSLAAKEGGTENETKQDC